MAPLQQACQNSAAISVGCCLHNWYGPGIEKLYISHLHAHTVKAVHNTHNWTAKKAPLGRGAPPLAPPLAPQACMHGRSGVHALIRALLKRTVQGTKARVPKTAPPRPQGSGQPMARCRVMSRGASDPGTFIREGPIGPRRTGPRGRLRSAPAPAPRRPRCPQTPPPRR